MAEIIMTALECARRHLQVATDFQTIYGYAMYGWKINDANLAIKIKQNLNGWYTQQHIATLRAVANRHPPVWGFDCVNLTKGILWGWCGDESKAYGGAVSRTNGKPTHGVPDTNANGMILKCYDVSTDFGSIEIGEGLWLEGHWGMYVGDGKAVECTGRWANGVQITAVHNIAKKAGLEGRYWTKHGKLPWIAYSGEADTVEPEIIELGSRIIRKGTQGTDVRELQEDLLKLGYPLPKFGADGDCGKETVNAIKLFQTDAGIEADGECGKETLRALQAALQRLGQPSDPAPSNPAEPRYTVVLRHLKAADADVVKARWPEAEVTEE